jgi:hypothetical protein
MTVRDFAEHLGVAIRTVSKWENRGAAITLQPGTQSMLDVALERTTPDERHRFDQLVGVVDGSPARGSEAAPEMLLPLIVGGRPILAPLTLDSTGSRAIVDLSSSQALRPGTWAQPGPASATEPDSGGDMDIARRQALGMLSFGIAGAALWGSDQAVAPTPPSQLSAAAVESIREAMVGYRTIVGDRAVQVDPGELAAAVNRAQRGYQAADYDVVAKTLPGLIAAADTVGKELRARTYVVAAKLLTKVGEAQLAWLCADRAAEAASDSESASASAAAAYQVVCAMLALGDSSRAEHLAVQFAEGFTNARMLRDPELLSHAGALWLVSAIIAARRGGQRESAERLSRAGDLGDRLGTNANLGWTAFGPVNVAIHRLSAAKERGAPREILDLGASLNTDALPTGLNGRRAEVHVNLAWAHTQLGNDLEAIHHLRMVEAVAPELLRFNRVGAATINDLLRRESRVRTPALRQLAARAGLA